MNIIFSIDCLYSLFLLPPLFLSSSLPVCLPNYLSLPPSLPPSSPSLCLFITHITTYFPVTTTAHCTSRFKRDIYFMSTASGRPHGAHPSPTRSHHESTCVHLSLASPSGLCLRRRGKFR